MEKFSSGSEFEKLIGYSRAVKDENYVFVSGTTGYDYASMTISENVVDQAEQCFKNIEEVLARAGTSLEKVVRINYILPRREDFEPCWPVFEKHLGKAMPAATAIIAELFNEKMKIEIEVTASL